MTVYELAARRATRRVAGARRRPPPEPAPGPDVGDPSVMAEDLRKVKDMVEEVMAEALVLGDNDVVAQVGALVLHVADVVATIERLEGG